MAQINSISLLPLMEPSDSTANDEMIALLLQQQFEQEEYLQNRISIISNIFEEQCNEILSDNDIPINQAVTPPPHDDPSEQYARYLNDKQLEDEDDEEDEQYEEDQIEREIAVNRFLGKKHIISANTLGSSTLRATEISEQSDSEEENLRGDNTQNDVYHFQDLPPNRQRLFERVAKAKETAYATRSKKASQIRMTLVLNQNRKQQKIKFVDYPSSLAQLCKIGTGAFNAKKKIQRVFDSEGTEIKIVTPDLFPSACTLYFSSGENFVTGTQSVSAPERPAVTTELPEHPVTFYAFLSSCHRLHALTKHPKYHYYKENFSLNSTILGLTDIGSLIILTISNRDSQFRSFEIFSDGHGRIPSSRGLSSIVSFSLSYHAIFVFLENGAIFEFKAPFQDSTFLHRLDLITFTELTHSATTIPTVQLADNTIVPSPKSFSESAIVSGGQSVPVFVNSDGSIFVRASQQDKSPAILFLDHSSFNQDQIVDSRSDHSHTIFLTAHGSILIFQGMGGTVYDFPVIGHAASALGRMIGQVQLPFVLSQSLRVKNIVYRDGQIFVLNTLGDILCTGTSGLEQFTDVTQSFLDNLHRGNPETIGLDLVKWISISNGVLTAVLG
ncbi:hypothetical protein BLNAU_6755 [Blattamonas nauphoetae]|uniref:Uncharacterized protein n=1 Tax=Blattamonas nauphoetae TaxID=2049346 RepID=A0ABQ9Y3K0_9EUKA|nr:hypothetical protein BLNAU_6755 [Blattamonas nauphoetae]